MKNHNLLELDLEKVSNGWLRKLNGSTTYYPDLTTIINQEPILEDESVSEGKYVIEIKIRTAKTLGELNAEGRAALIERDKEVFNPNVRKVVDGETEFNPLDTKSVYSAIRLKSINFTKYFSESKLKDRELAEIAGLKSATFSSLKRNIRLGTTTFSHINVRIAATILAKYFEKMSKLNDED